jgi:lysophospholipase L1-like esterase
LFNGFFVIWSGSWSATRRTAALIRAHALERGVVLVDLFSGLVDKEGNLRQEYSDDGVHLTQTGYGRVAKLVLGSLIPIIEKMNL